MSFSGDGEGRIPESAQRECEFLESILPVKSFVHLTTRHRMTSDHLKSFFHAWIHGIQQHHRVTVGWVRSIEHFPKLHIHAALIAPIPIDCNYAAELWETLAAPAYSDAAIVEPYRKGQCGLGYVLKQLNCPADSSSSAITYRHSLRESENLDSLRLQHRDGKEGGSGNSLNKRFINTPCNNLTMMGILSFV